MAKRATEIEVRVKGHRVRVKVTGVEKGGRHCAPSVDWDLIGEYPEDVDWYDVNSEVKSAML